MRVAETACAIAAALVLGSGCTVPKPPEKAAAAAPATPYGANKAASGTFVHDGVTLYYETYGQGEPLLLIHGNGATIGSLAAQIEYFKGHRRVIAMDSRDHGRSGDSAGPITYEKMADDQAALLDHLKAGPADVVGWSDGGIEALLLGLRHPTKIRKLVAMAANLNPEAVYPEVTKMVADMFAAMPPGTADTPAGRRQIRVAKLLSDEPHIDPAQLAKVTAPTLILSGDKDVIRLDHTVRIYESLPNADLAVLPNNTHAAPYDDAALFNALVDRFLKTPFRKKDRIADMMASLDKLTAGLAK